MIPVSYKKHKTTIKKPFFKNKKSGGGGLIKIYILMQWPSCVLMDVYDQDIAKHFKFVEEKIY